MSKPVRYVGALAALALAAACGSTVPSASRTGLTPEGALGVTTPGGAGPDLGGSSGSATGGTSSGALVGGTTGAATTTGGPVTVAPDPGTTTGAFGGPRRAVKVGILLTKVGQADALGLSVGNTFSERQFDDAVIAGINKHGGLHGHKVVPVYAGTDTASTSWESDYSAACSTFTQDNRVDAVLGSSFAYFASFESCLAKAGVPHLSNTSNVADNAELGRFPLLRNLIVPTIDKRSIAKLQGAMTAGFLTPASKLGVITDSCPGTQRAWNDVVKPFLAQHRITVASTADEGCADGYNGSFSAAGAAVSNAILTFRSSGVDRITFVTVSESGTMIAMSAGATSQRYYPGWILSSLAGTSLLASQAPADEMAPLPGRAALALRASERGAAPLLRLPQGRRHQARVRRGLLVLPKHLRGAVRLRGGDRHERRVPRGASGRAGAGRAGHQRAERLHAQRRLPVQPHPPQRRAAALPRGRLGGRVQLLQLPRSDLPDAVIGAKAQRMGLLAAGQRST